MAKNEPPDGEEYDHLSYCEQLYLAGMKHAAEAIEEHEKEWAGSGHASAFIEEVIDSVEWSR